MQRIALISVLLALILIDPTITQAQNPLEPQKKEPTVVAAVAPVFPPIARAARTKGDVVVEVRINSDGQVTDTRVMSGHKLLQKASEVAARKWKFDSAGNERSARLTFNFGYVDGKNTDPEYIVTFMPPYRIEVIWNPPAPGY